MVSAPSSIKGAHESQLRELAKRVRKLLSSAKEDDFPILDYLVGSIHALIRARENVYKDRAEALAGSYWRRGPTDTARLLEDGVIRTSGRWLAGFYFNSSLVRIAATFDRFIGVLRDSKQGKQLRRAEEKRIREQCAHALKVVNEVDKLKHERSGVALGRYVTADDAVVALQEVVALAELACELPMNKPTARAAEHTNGRRG
jgi:hypothetical protein